jgi:hypothetical protein
MSGRPAGSISRGRMLCPPAGVAQNVGSDNHYDRETPHG